MVRRVALVLVMGASQVSSQSVKVADFNDIFEWVRRVDLEQTKHAIASSPRITADPMGGWLVFDPPEGQVRMHDSAGRLKQQFGRRGSGPGEFSRLAAVLRVQSGELVTVDMSGRLARWSANGSKLLDEFRVPIQQILAAEVAGRDSVLLLTPPLFARGGSSGPVLHVVDLGKRQLVRSFFEPDIPANARNAWVTFIGGGIAASGNLIGVTLPLLDSLLVLNSVAGPPSRITLGIRRDPREIPDARVDRVAFLEWAKQIPVVGSVHALAEGWLIPIVRVGPEADSADLIFVPRAGGSPVIVRGAPIVIGTDRIAGEVLFDDRERLEPQYLRTARIRLRNH